jgi:aminoglycoside 6'-N-acetyltransferase
VQEDLVRTGELTWRRLTAEDLPLLGRWLAEPVVARWWAHDATPEGVERDFGASVRGEEAGEDLVVSLGGSPVGLVQRAVISDYAEDLAELSDLVEVPDGAVEIDYLIGDAALRGRGLGPRMIAALVADTWTRTPPVPAVIIPVAAANTASWRALEKAGLRRIAEGPLVPESPADGDLHFVYRIDRP